MYKVIYREVMVVIREVSKMEDIIKSRVMVEIKIKFLVECSIVL